jgi:uncharacterized Zn-binding protein involved in type VI secretion
MPAPAVVQGDMITGTCPVHQIPGPPVGNPVPTPLPFSAPVTQMTAMTVLIGGRPAAVVGSQGMCTPPHVGLHVSDPFLVPLMQVGRIVSGSATVFFEGKPAASSQSQTTLCAGTPGVVAGTAATVLIG